MGRYRGPRLPLRLCCPTGPELPVGPVTDLQATELPGQRVRVSWSPVPSATEYRITVRSIQGEGDTARPVHTLKFQPFKPFPPFQPFSTPGSLQPPPLSLSIHLPRRHRTRPRHRVCLLPALTLPVSSSGSVSTPCPTSLAMAFTLLHSHKLNPRPSITLAVTTVLPCPHPILTPPHCLSMTCQLMSLSADF